LNLPPNLILVGFMGSGKTSTGRVLAARMGFEFIDTDQVLESEAGLTIREIFRVHGEPAFRAMEVGLLERLTARDRQVIATGGGFWMAEAIRTRLLQVGFCVWLRTGEAQTWERVRGDLPSRPLLSRDPDPERKIRELIAARTPAYSQAHASVDTDGKTPEAVAGEIGILLKERHPFDLPPLPA